MKLLRLLAIFLMLITTACRLVPKGGPNWDTDLIAPIAYTRLTVFDTVSDSLFEEKSDGLLLPFLTEGPYPVPTWARALPC